MPADASERLDGSPFLNLNRPQYANMPELLISALVWGVAERSDRAKELRPLIISDGDEGTDAVAYEKHGLGKPKDLTIGYTRPSRGDARWDEVVKNLQRELDVTEPKAAIAAEVLLKDLRALRPAKSKSYAALPINLKAALLQDRRGLLRVSGPVNYSSILERMYKLGGGRGSAALKLVTAFQKSSRAGNEWLNEVVAAFSPKYMEIAEELITEGVENRDQKAGGNQPAWLAGSQTPFSWFTSSWDSLCDDQWINRMPRRRWVDWASCVLRNALGIGFLFEMNFLRAMALGVISVESAEATRLSALSQLRPLLRWDDQSKVSSREVGKPILTAAEQGTASARLIERWIDEREFPDPRAFEQNQDGLVDWLNQAREQATKVGRSDLEREISVEFENAKGSRTANNVDETISYSLLERSDAPGAGDLYGLIRRRGRYEIVDPGQEWLVVVSSLATGPGQSSLRVADIDEALQALRLRPGLNSIVKRLEASGLARGSHDADEAIEVQVAF